jgi:hypothetical protein
MGFYHTLAGLYRGGMLFDRIETLFFDSSDYFNCLLQLQFIDEAGAFAPFVDHE